MIIPIITRKEKIKLDEHIKDQRRLRHIGKNLSKEDVELVMSDIIERSYWMMVDFLKKEKFTENKRKLKKAWKYLKEGLK